MNATDLLNHLAAEAGRYIFDDIGTGEIVLREASGTDFARLPYGLIEPLIDQRYIARDANSARVYRVTPAGSEAAGRGDVRATIAQRR